MNRLTLTASIALAAMVALVSAPSYAARPIQNDTTPHASKMNDGDQFTGKDVTASVPPSQDSFAATETIHYKNVPSSCWFRCGGIHDTTYVVQRQLTAQWVAGVKRWILQDPDGTWYAFDTGNTTAVQLNGKPSYDAGARTSVMGSGDSRVLARVDDGGPQNSGRALTAVYNYTHVEALANVTYTMAESVSTTYVPEQQASFAWIGQNLYSVDGSGHALYRSEKPWTDRGLRGSQLSSSDEKLDTSVSYNSYLFFAVTRTYVHEEDFQKVRYSVQSSAQADLVQLDSGSAYMAWIDGNEYAVSAGSASVQRLNDKPVVHLGNRQSSLIGDAITATEVVSVAGNNNPVLVTLRYTFVNDDHYVTNEYYVETQYWASYNQNGFWVMNVNGRDYVVAFDNDDTSSWSGNVVHAPSSIPRPSYVVPGTGGAVVPGRPVDDGAGNQNTCIQGVNCPQHREEHRAAPHGNSCIQGVNCPQDTAPVTPKGNSCIKGVNC
jgi:hypothetical protein